LLIEYFDQCLHKGAVNAYGDSRTMTPDPKILAEKLNILAVMVAGQGGEVRIPHGKLGGGERLEFSFDRSTNEHVVKLVPEAGDLPETITLQAPEAPELAKVEAAWAAAMPSPWRGIMVRIEDELLAMKLGADLNIAGWLETAEHFVLCADKLILQRGIIFPNARFAVVESEVTNKEGPYRRLSKLIVRRVL